MSGEPDPILICIVVGAMAFAGLLFLRAMALQVRNRVEVIDIAREAVRLRVDYEVAKQRREEARVKTTVRNRASVEMVD